MGRGEETKVSSSALWDANPGSFQIPRTQYCVRTRILLTKTLDPLPPTVSLRSGRVSEELHPHELRSSGHWSVDGTEVSKALSTVPTCTKTSTTWLLQEVAFCRWHR